LAAVSRYLLSLTTGLRALGFAALLAGLSACQTGFPGAGPTQIALFDGALKVAAPPGYCIDPETAVETGDSAVVLIGRCRDGSAITAALVTVTVGSPGSAGVLAAGNQALSDFFTSAQGRATLSRSGRAEDVTVSRAVAAEGDFLMLLTDRNAGTYWRAIIGLKGRVVTVSAAGTDEVKLNPESARKVLDATLAALRRANPAP
jgi:hypothetical protein